MGVVFYVKWGGVFKRGVKACNLQKKERFHLLFKKEQSKPKNHLKFAFGPFLFLPKKLFSFFAFKK